MGSPIETLHRMAEERCPILGGRQPEARAAEWALKEIDRLRDIEDAARNLVKQKGRHHTEQAYQRLAALVVPNAEVNSRPQRTEQGE